MDRFDLLVVGGGINGAAIAREAAHRGLAVLLVERDDLAAHTSSASSKLIHGGLRYLEQYEFRLVREALAERRILLRTAPHLVRPLRFVLPVAPGMRPWWMIRAGLGLYDLLAGRDLPRARTLRPADTELAAPLRQPGRAFLYWDAWVDDARLVVLNARDAADRGARIRTRTALVAARRAGDAWQADLSDGSRIAAAAIVNAAGPWVADVLGRRLHERAASRVRLIRGTHIVVPALFAGDHAYILQQPDGRVVFAIAYEGRFTLVGTTDAPARSPEDAAPSPDEIAYLQQAAARYLGVPREVVHAFAGIRALYDDGAADAKEVTRDYRLELDPDPGPALLSVFGGKITTARALAAEALAKLGHRGRSPTRRAPLPGGDIADFAAFLAESGRRWPWLEPAPLLRLARAYGTHMERILGAARTPADLGEDYGAGLTAAELDYLVREEWAATAEDVLWRRTKRGLHMHEAQRARIAKVLGC